MLSVGWISLYENISISIDCKRSFKILIRKLLRHEVLVVLVDSWRQIVSVHACTDREVSHLESATSTTCSRNLDFDKNLNAQPWDMKEMTKYRITIGRCPTSTCKSTKFLINRSSLLHDVVATIDKYRDAQKGLCLIPRIVLVYFDTTGSRAVCGLAAFSGWFCNYFGILTEPRTSFLCFPVHKARRRGIPLIGFIHACEAIDRRLAWLSFGSSLVIAYVLEDS